MSVHIGVQEIVVINDNCCILSQRLTRLAVISARKNSYVALIVTNCIIWKWLHKSVGHLFAKASYKVRFAKLHGLIKMMVVEKIFATQNDACYQQKTEYFSLVMDAIICTRVIISPSLYR